MSITRPSGWPKQSRKRHKRNWKLIPALIIILIASVAHCNEIAYDCASVKDVIATFSLTDTAKCPPYQRSYKNSTAETIQVVQKTSNTRTKAHTCKVIMNRRVCRCQFFSSSQFGCTPSMIDYQLPVTSEQCRHMAATGIFVNDEFNVTNIQTNIPSWTTFVSHGSRLPSGYCAGTTFTRNDVIYTKSFEQTDVKISMNTLSLQIEPSHIEVDTEDVLLPFGIRYPARFQSIMDPRIGTTVWNYKRPSCPQFGQPIEGFQTIYQGKAQIAIRTGAKFQDKFEGALFSVNIEKPTDTEIPQTFALASHTNTTICGRTAWNTNVEDVLIIILNYGERAINTDKKYGLSRPHLLDFKSQVTAQYLYSHNRIEDVAEKLYISQCSTEEKTIKNFQSIITSTQFPSLKPYFDEGFTAIPAGSAIHVIQCPTISVTIDTHRSGCFEELPVLKLAKDGTPLNGSFWAHPVTRIITDRGTPITCSEGLPLMYKLIGGTYVCQTGRGLHTCEAPDILKPDSVSLSEQISHSFHKILGIGILSAATIRDFAIRVHEPFYRNVLKAQMVARNIAQGYVAKGKPLEPLPSINFSEEITDLVGAKISPAFSILGKTYVHIISAFVVLAIISGVLGIITRIYWEINNHGMTTRLVFVLFNGLWSASRMPLDILKSGIKGASDNALNSNVVVVTEPLQEQINELSSMLANINQEDQSQNRNRSNSGGNGSTTPPPSYHSDKPTALITEEQTVVYRNRRHSFHGNNTRKVTNDNLQRADDQSVPMDIAESPDQQRLHQRRRQPMTPVTTRTDQQHRYPEEIELQQMETEDGARRLSPLTQSASSTLRDDLARFQDQEFRRYHDSIHHNKPSTSRATQPLTPIYSDCHFPWQPPMAQPPTPDQPTEPAPQFTQTHRRRMNMRVNLPPTEDQPPRKISRQNSRSNQVDTQSTTEANHRPQCCTSTRESQDQETEVYETSLPIPQQHQRLRQNETIEQTHEDNIPELFKTIASKKI